MPFKHVIGSKHICADSAPSCNLPSTLSNISNDEKGRTCITRIDSVRGEHDEPGRTLKTGWGGLILLCAMTLALPAFSQQKTGPGITGDDSLTWYGITLYGVIDIGLQYETHGAPLSGLPAGGQRQHRAEEQPRVRYSGRRPATWASQESACRAMSRVRRLVGRVPSGDLLQSAVRRNRRFPEIANREQRQTLAKPVEWARWQARRAKPFRPPMSA